MNKKGKTIARILALFLALLFLIGAIGSAVFATSWDDDVYAHGSGLSEQQISDTAKFLGVESEQTPRIIIRGEDSQKYLNEPATDAAMISSVYIKKNNSRTVSVEVITPLTIQSVTSMQYANAAVTAGVTGLDIKVGAVVPVSGTSALSGVYKALESKGIKLDTQRTQTANEEIQIINEITENNKENEGFSKEQLNEAVLEGKQEVIEVKENNGIVNTGDVENIVQNVIKDNNLTQVFNNLDIENLNIILNNFGNLVNNNNFNLDEVKMQLQDLASKAQDFAQKEVARVQEFFKTEEGQKYIDSIKDTLNPEQLNALIEGGKEALSSPQLEGLLNGIKENLSPDKLGSLVESAKNSIGIDSETINNVKEKSAGFFSWLGDFFKSIFDGIANLFRG